MKIVTNKEEIEDGLYSFIRTEYSDKSCRWTFKNGNNPTYWDGSIYVDLSNELEEKYQKIKNANYNGEHPEVDNPVAQQCDLKARETDKERPKDGIWYKGKHLELSYIELFNLLEIYVLNGTGTLYTKCMNAFNTIIPTSKG